MFNNILLPLVPQTWENVNPHVQYELKDVTDGSTEYISVKNNFVGIQVLKIERVQNLYQLGLFKIRAEETSTVPPIITKGYHPIYKDDLEICMKYPLDYRRYSKTFYGQSMGNQPKIYVSANEAYAVIPTSSLDNYQKIIVVCEVFNMFNIERQSDYLPIYVVYVK